MIKIVNLKSFDLSLEYVASFCNKNPNQELTIIVPDKLSLFMEKQIFNALNIEASFDIKVSTLDRLVKKDCDIEKSKQISKLGSVILTHKILSENFKDLRVLKNKTNSFSYAEEIFNTIAQFKASHISCEEMQNFSSPNPQLRDKVLDLAMIYQQYEQGKAGLLDMTDQFLMCCFNLRQRFSNKSFLFVGFDDFTAVEYTAIECLALNNQVCVINYFAKSNNMHIYSHEVFDQLKNIAYINNLPFESTSFETETDSLKSFLRENLFGVKQRNFYDGQGRIKVFSAQDDLNEIDRIARDIRIKILNGASFGQFGVAIFGLDKNINVIKQVFDKYDLNFYLDSQFLLNQTALYKLVCDVLKYQSESFELSHLIDIINSPFFMMDNSSKQKLILKLISIDFKGKLTKKYDFKDLNDLRDELIDFISLFDVELDNVSQIKEAILKAFDILNVEQVAENLSQQTSISSSKILLKKSVDTLQNVFDEIEKFYPDADKNQFAEIFLHLGDLVKINNLPLTLDAIKIVDANNFSEAFDYLYFANCSAENAPALKNDCGIILDGEIEQLNFAHKLSPTIKHINHLARLRLFNACLLFNKGLVLSYNHLPSELITEFCKLLQINTISGIQNLCPIPAEDSERLQALSAKDYVEKNLQYNTKLVSEYVVQKNLTQLSPATIKKVKLETVSSSRLESYFRCPFSNFVVNVLRVSPRPKNDILPIDTGNILHSILFNYYKANKQVGDLYQFAKNQINKQVENNDRLKLKADSPLLTNLIDETVRVLKGVDYIDNNSNFKPTGFEFKFKTDKLLENASLIGTVDRVDSDGQNLRIVDYKTGVAEASLKELYYGNKLQLFLYANAIEKIQNKPVLGEFYLPLHNAYGSEKNTYALKGFFENTPTNVHNMDVRLTPGQKSDIVNITMTKENIARNYGDKELNAQEMQLLKNYACKLSNQAISEMASGYIKPSPSGVVSPCNSCPYDHICLKYCNAVEERKPKSVNNTSFEEGEQ